jgi:hypothetical protein
MILDERCSLDQIREFATRFNQFSEAEQAELKTLFQNDKSGHFYLGLLTGYMASMIIIEGGKSALLPNICCAVADILERYEVV